MRLLIAITNQDRRAAVYFNRDLDEYTVRFYSHGEHLTNADSYLQLIPPLMPVNSTVCSTLNLPPSTNHRSP